MGEVWDGVKCVTAFLDKMVGVERSIAADAICGGVDKPWAMAYCGKIGPHGQHRGDEDPPYFDGGDR
ncbi:hypothetical protein AB0F72_08765 [Actinoplanes sp. NPDC023936]|uniref:hypothetical protein n=1 Tax=Actinoplanes sp. NPDC023936 TaxID=3154910 RepID=UPI0033C2CACD